MHPKDLFYLNFYNKHARRSVPLLTGKPTLGCEKCSEPKNRAGAGLEPGSGSLLILKLTGCQPSELTPHPVPQVSGMRLSTAPSTHLLPGAGKEPASAGSFWKC